MCGGVHYGEVEGLVSREGLCEVCLMTLPIPASNSQSMYNHRFLSRSLLNERPSSSHPTKVKVLESFEYEVDEYDVSCGRCVSTGLPSCHSGAVRYQASDSC